MPNETPEPAVFEGRGDHVTAITAILNLNNAPFDFVHRKYRHYDRLIPPGFFKYPYGTTAPINWGAWAGGLMRFGDHGAMWQSDRHVYYKIGGDPAHDTDGTIVYTRQHALPGEQYLILGLKGNQLTTLKSYTPREALFQNLTDALLGVTRVLSPTDYAYLLRNSGHVNTFVNRLRAANDAGQLNDLDPQTLETLSKISYQDFNNQLVKLSPEERAVFHAPGDDNPSRVEIARRVFVALGLKAASASAMFLALAGFFGVIASLSAAFGPASWATVTAVTTLLAAGSLVMSGISYAILGVCVLITQILTWIEPIGATTFFGGDGQALLAT